MHFFGQKGVSIPGPKLSHVMYSIKVIICNLNISTLVPINFRHQMLPTTKGGVQGSKPSPNKYHILCVFMEACNSYTYLNLAWLYLFLYTYLVLSHYKPVQLEQL